MALFIYCWIVSLKFYRSMTFIIAALLLQTVILLVVRIMSRLIVGRLLMSNRKITKHSRENKKKSERETLS